MTTAKYVRFHINPVMLQIAAKLQAKQLNPEMNLIFEQLGNPTIQLTCEAENEMFLHFEYSQEQLTFCFSEPNGGTATKPMPFLSLDHSLNLWDKAILAYSTDSIDSLGLEWFGF